MKNLLLFIFLITSYYAGSSQTSKFTFVLSAGIPEGKLKTRIESNTLKLLHKVNESYTKNSDILEIASDIVTQNGIENISQLWKSGKFYCAQGNISEKLLQLENKMYQVRNIPFVFGKTDTIDVVIEFLPDGLINDMYVGLNVHQTTGILKSNSVLDRTRREIILNFLEIFRTSYEKKDISYIEKLYSDKALIITGRVLKEENYSTDVIQSKFTKKEIEYQVQTKSQYISRLRNLFKSIRSLRLNFSQVEVMQHRKHSNFYGVMLRQVWNSTDYKDDGYLFLLIQFKNIDDPLIWVRTWQDTKITPADNIFGLHNFVIPTVEKVN